MENLQQAELIIAALQQRIGEMAATYETQIAILRSEITIKFQEQEDKKKAEQEYSANLKKKIS